MGENQEEKKDEIVEIEENTEGKFLGIFGEEKVNVLELNLSLAKEISMV